MSTTKSTGLKDKLLDTGSFRTIMALGFINIYSGSRPATADEAVPAGCVLLATIKNGADDSTGLTLEADATSGSLGKTAAETWREDSVLATGVATWFRYYEAADTPADASTANARIDGSVGTSGADLNLSSVNLTASAPINVTTAEFTVT